MSTYGSITSYIDVGQLTLYGFWIFFAGLIFYLRTEDKREGFPMESERYPGRRVSGFPPAPSPKTFLTRHGAIKAPHDEPLQTVKARPTETWPGAPLTPTGNPLVDGVGPAAWAPRADHPALTWDDEVPMIVPLRAANGFFLASEDPDPRGFAVIGADDKQAGVVTDVWVDRSEVIMRYIELDVTASGGVGRRLVPSTLVRIDAKRKQVKVESLLAGQFAEIPVLKSSDQITLLEEDKVSAYVGGGNLYAETSRLGPIL